MSSTGYPQVGLRRDGKAYTRHVHRLILETFIGPCPEGMECRHLDGDSVNNRLDNLKWGTHSENMQDSIRHGTHVVPRQRGELNGRAKLTADKVLLIRKIWEDYRDHITQPELGAIFGIARNTVGYIINRKRWAHI